MEPEGSLWGGGVRTPLMAWWQRARRKTGPVPDAVSVYLANIQRELGTGHAQEHTYRPALKGLLEATTKLNVVNEPSASLGGVGRSASQTGNGNQAP